MRIPNPVLRTLTTAAALGLALVSGAPPAAGATADEPKGLCDETADAGTSMLMNGYQVEHRDELSAEEQEALEPQLNDDLRFARELTERLAASEQARDRQLQAELSGTLAAAAELTADATAAQRRRALEDISTALLRVAYECATSDTGLWAGGSLTIMSLDLLEWSAGREYNDFVPPVIPDGGPRPRPESGPEAARRIIGESFEASAVARLWHSEMIIAMNGIPESPEEIGYGGHRTADFSIRSAAAGVVRIDYHSEAAGLSGAFELVPGFTPGDETVSFSCVAIGIPASLRPGNCQPRAD